MVGSNETTTFADHSTSEIMLNIKTGQNLILDLKASRYNEALKPMIKCLRYSLLAQSLTMEDNVPLVHLSKAYSYGTYSQQEGVIQFEVASHKTSISKPSLCIILGLSTTEALVDPKSILVSALINMLFQMGYTGDLSLLSKFRKTFLPPYGMTYLLFSSRISLNELLVQTVQVSCSTRLFMASTKE